MLTVIASRTRRRSADRGRRYWDPGDAWVLHYAHGNADSVATKLRRLLHSTGDWWHIFPLSAGPPWTGVCAPHLYVALRDAMQNPTVNKATTLMAEAWLLFNGLFDLRRDRTNLHSVNSGLCRRGLALPRHGHGGLHTSNRHQVGCRDRSCDSVLYALVIRVIDFRATRRIHSALYSVFTIE